MKSKSSTSLPVSDRIVKSLYTYAVATRELLTDCTLTGEELRLLIYLMTHDLPDARNGGHRKGYVYLSRDYLARAFARSKRQISNLLRGLDNKQYIRREFQKGDVTVVQLLKTMVTGETGIEEKLQGSEPSPLKKTFKTPLKKICKGPLKKTFNQKNRMEDENRKSRKATDPDVKILLDYFCKQYEQAFKYKYTVSGKRDGQTFKDILKDHPVEILQRCIDLFMTDTNPFVDGNRTIPVLRSQINRYIQTISVSAAAIPAAYRKFE